MADPEAPLAYVHQIRKDGKFPVTFVYPISGRKLSKLLSADQLRAEKLTGYYKMIFVA